MYFTTTFNCDNSAFQGYNEQHEIARILRDIADKIETYGTENGTTQDINGNTVGTFETIREVISE